MLSAHAFLSSHNGTYIAKTTGVTTGQFSFFSSWKQRLVCEPRKARDSTMPGDKTRTPSLFTAVISFNLAAVCAPDRWDLHCYHFISMWSKLDYSSGQEHMLSLSMSQCRFKTQRRDLFRQGLSTQHHAQKYYRSP